MRDTYGHERGGTGGCREYWVEVAEGKMEPSGVEMKEGERGESRQN